MDFRLVSASLRELDRLIHEQGFREDLYYRINGMRVVIAPLRERQDIPELIKKLLPVSYTHLTLPTNREV